MSFEKLLRMDENEAMMHLSQVVFALASLLMIAGGIEIAVTGGVRFPGTPAVPIMDLLRLSFSSTGLELMSLGIVLLAVLPSLRILVVITIYIKQRRWFDVLTALVVLLILLSGTSLSRLFVK